MSLGSLVSQEYLASENMVGSYIASLRNYSTSVTYSTKEFRVWACPQNANWAIAYFKFDNLVSACSKYKQVTRTLNLVQDTAYENPIPRASHLAPRSLVDYPKSIPRSIRMCSWSHSHSSLETLRDLAKCGWYSKGLRAERGEPGKDASHHRRFVIWVEGATLISAIDSVPVNNDAACHQLVPKGGWESELINVYRALGVLWRNAFINIRHD